MPRTKTMTCYICNEPMWQGTTSKPQGEAAHNKCRKAAAKTCADCGKPASGRDTRCNSCRYQHAKATAKATCFKCDRPATARGMCLSHYSEDYRARRGRKRTTFDKDCEHCSADFQTVSKETVFCSLTCAQRARNVKSTDLVKYLRPRVWAGQTIPSKNGAALVAGQCAYCPSYFVGTAGSRYCSERCANNSAWKRRYERRGEFKVTDKLRLAIYERDAHTCQICNKAVDITLHYHDKMSATLDHIVPQSHMLVPDHSANNLRLAHRICNSVRGDRVATTQPQKGARWR